MKTPPQQQAAVSPTKKSKTVDVFLSLSSRDLLNLLNQKTVTQEKSGIAFAFSLSDFDADDVSMLEGAYEALEDLIQDLTDEGEGDLDEDDEDASEFDEDPEEKEEKEP